MKKLLFNKWLLLTARVTMGAILIYAGLLKIAEPMQFADHIAAFRLLPNLLVNLTALFVPMFEMAVGLLLVIGVYRGTALLSVVILGTTFALALISALLRNLKIDCGCFGGSQYSTWGLWISLARVLVMIAVALWLYRLNCRRLNSDS